MLRSNSEKLQDGIEMAKKQVRLNFSPVLRRFSFTCKKNRNKFVLYSRYRKAPLEKSVTLHALI